MSTYSVVVFLLVVPLVSATTGLGGSSPQLRQAENACSPKVIAKMSPRTRAYALAQPDIDRRNDEYTPRLADNYHEKVPGMGEVKLGTLVARSVHGVVFKLANQSDYVIKYQTNCDLRDKAVHPLLKDYWLGVEAAALNVSAKPIFVSPAVSLAGATGQKVSFLLDRYNLDRCARLGGVVRFMVMERLGACVRDMFPDPDLGHAVSVGRHAVYLLSSLHDAGMFHGDIHPGNICESLSEPGMLRLIDFGNGGFVEDETNREAAVKMNPHYLLTEWQMVGHPFARRDDIYKTIELIATVAIGEGMWYGPRDWAIDNAGKLLGWKRTGTLFGPNLWTSRTASLYRLSSEQRQRITALLNGVHMRARRLVDVHSVIPYDEIAKALAAAHDLIHTGTEVTSSTSAMPTAGVIITTSIEPTVGLFLEHGSDSAADTTVEPTGGLTASSATPCAMTAEAVADLALIESRESREPNATKRRRICDDAGSSTVSVMPESSLSDAFDGIEGE